MQTHGQWHFSMCPAAAQNEFSASALQQLQAVAPASKECSGNRELASAVSTRRHGIVAHGSSIPAAARANGALSSEPMAFSSRAVQQLQAVAPLSTECSGKGASASAVSTRRHSMVVQGSPMPAAARANDALSSKLCQRKGCGLLVHWMAVRLCEWPERVLIEWPALVKPEAIRLQSASAALDAAVDALAAAARLARPKRALRARGGGHGDVILLPIPEGASDSMRARIDEINAERLAVAMRAREERRREAEREREAAVAAAAREREAAERQAAGHRWLSARHPRA